MRTRLAVLVLAAMFIAGELACTPTERGAAIGAGTGAAAGALIDHHHRTRGAVVGAVAGGVIGGAIGYSHEFTKVCPTCGRRFHCSRVACPFDSTPLVDLRSQPQAHVRPIKPPFGHPLPPAATPHVP